MTTSTGPERAPADSGDAFEESPYHRVMKAHADALDSGRPAAVERQHAKGKLTARERVDHLVDRGSFLEYGRLAQATEGEEFVGAWESPADGVVIGVGEINGRPASIISSDFTVMGGSIGQAGQMKMERAVDLALDHGMPLIMLLDGGGHRIQGGLDSREFAFGGPGPFTSQVRMSGWVPQVTAMMGPGFAGPANFSAVADYVPIVRGTGSIGIAGPALVKFATGEDKDAQSLGGADVHLKTGVLDDAYDDDLSCLEGIKAFLDFFPSNAGQPLPILPSTDPADRRCPELRDVVPTNRRRAYDVRKVITPLVDDGNFMEIKAKFAPNMVTAFARMEGRPVGIIANQPKVLAGVVDSPACDKASRFVSMCDAFGLPIISLIDMPGFLVGSKAEETALVRHSGKLLTAFGNSSVPIVSVVLRKGYGLGYMAMAGGRSFGAEAALAWPSAELCAMQIEGAVDVAYKKDYLSAPDPQARRAEIIAGYYENVDPLRAASGFGIDDVIDPADTRAHLCAVLRFAEPRSRVLFPPRRHGIEPV